jgi:hypothetical protein
MGGSRSHARRNLLILWLAIIIVTPAILIASIYLLYAVVFTVGGGGD